MRNLLLLIAVAAGGYCLYTEHFAATAIDVDSYQALLQKVEATSVGLDEVKVETHQLVTFFCNDASYEQATGKTSASCIARYENYRDMCENRIFSQSPQTFANKADVIAVASRYVACTGIKNS